MRDRDKRRSRERVDASLERVGVPNIQLYSSRFSCPLLWKMFMAGAAGGIYINKLPSHKPVVSLGNTTLSSCVRSNNQAD